MKIFDKSIKYRVEKYYGFASNNARAESLTMKQYRSSTNNSDGLFVYRSPFNLRSSSVQPPFVLRSTSVRAPFGDRRLIEERTENHRRQDGDVSKL